MSTEDDENATENFFEIDCVSEFLGRTTEGLRLFSAAFAVVASLVYISGFVLWYVYRNNIWLQRRNPSVVLCYIVPALTNWLIGPLDRALSGFEGNLLSTCLFTNFLIIIVTITVIIPNMTRAISFSYRVKLNKKLFELDVKADQEEDFGEEEGRSTNKEIATSASQKTGPQFYGDKVRLTEKGFSDGASYLQADDVMNRLRYRSSSSFARLIAYSSVGFMMVVALIHALLTCPVSFLGRDEVCEIQGNITTTILIVVPVLLALGVLIYFYRQTSQAPDPFKIHREYSIYFVLLFAAVFFFVLNTFNVGGFLPDEEDLDSKISGFHFSLLTDLFGVLMFIHAVPLQVYFSIQYERSLKIHVPVSLEETLRDPKLCQIFKRYLETEFSVELLIVYQLVLKWRKQKEALNHNDFVLDAKARSIFSKWIEPSSGIQENMQVINISNNLREEVSQVLSNTTNQPLPSNLFKDIERELYRLMDGNGFIRFVNTVEYKRFVGAVDNTQDI